MARGETARIEYLSEGEIRVRIEDLRSEIADAERLLKTYLWLLDEEEE